MTEQSTISQRPTTGEQSTISQRPVVRERPAVCERPAIGRLRQREENGDHPLRNFASGRPSGTRRWPARLIVGGVAALALGALFSAERVWGNLLLSFSVLAGFGLAALFLLALLGVTGARWARPLIPVLQKLAATLPPMALLLGLTALAGLLFYPWAQGGAAHGPTFWFQHAWLAPGFFAARTAAYVLVWVLLAWRMASPRWQSRPGSSAAALVLLGVSVSLAGFDWIMSLEPHWFSTMFGVYQFAGILLSGLAAVVLLAAWFKRTGIGEDIQERHLHDLGKLLFGFSCFWMYIWFSQYMLIWYTNIPEEAVYYARRVQGLWGPLTWLSLILNWGIPFFVLLPRPAKQSWRVMSRVAAVILAGRCLDVYLMVLPPLAGPQPVLGLPEIGGVLLMTGVSAYLVIAATRAELAPQPQPRVVPA